MPAGNRVDPYPGFRFRVEIEGIQNSQFCECTGLGSQIEVIEYREGSDQPRTRKIPGRAIYPDIVLKRGITWSADLYKWYQNVLNGQLDRRQGSIVLLDEQGNDVFRWNFFDAFPIKIELGGFKAEGNELAIETLTIACEKQEPANP